VKLGMHSFAHVQLDPNSGALASTVEAMCNLREAIALAHAVRGDYFGIGYTSHMTCRPLRARRFSRHFSSGRKKKSC
jgi:hypothetical protein